jgi:hypothetical protein
MLESVSTDSRHYPQVRGARFAEVGGRFTGMPRMTLRLRYRTLKLRALCWVLLLAGTGASLKELPSLAPSSTSGRHSVLILRPIQNTCSASM